jgi:hypothetical protein
LLIPDSVADPDSCVFGHLYDFLPLENYVIVPSKSNKQKKVEKEIVFLLVS